jgi:peptide/nickel transport system substrate-binding protein
VERSATVSNWSRRAIALALVFALAAAACGGSKSASTTTTKAPGGSSSTTAAPAKITMGGSLTFGSESDVQSLMPGVAAQPADKVITLGIYDPLMSYDNDGKLVPYLATSLKPSDDLLTWTMALNKGVIFQDDTPLNADAVVKHFNRLKDPATGCTCKDSNAIITSMDMPDGPTGLSVVFHLNKPNVAFGELLAGSSGYIESPTAIAKDPKGFETKPVGSGPFVLSQFIKGDKVVLTKFAKYWKKDAAGNQLPYLDTLTIVPIADGTQRLNALKAGNIQMFQSAVSNVVKQAEDAGFAAQKSSGSSSTIILLNNAKPPFNNVKARQALAYAIDKDIINQRAYDGIRVPSYSGFAPDSPYFNKSAGTPKHDAAKAAALVKELGGLTFKLECIPTPEAKQILEIVKAQGEAAGMKITLSTQEQGAYVGRIFSKVGDYEAACFRSTHFIDPDAIRSGLTTGDAGNYVFYTNPAVDKALEDGRSTTDFAKRKAAYDIVQTITGQEVPLITTLYDLFGNVYDKTKAGPPPVSEPNALGAIKPGYLHLA